MGKKGGPKTGGRKPGSINKNSLTFRELLDRFEDGKGFEPVNEMMNLYTLIHADNPLVAVKILIAFLDRLHPVSKNIAHSGQINTIQNITTTNIQISEMVKNPEILEDLIKLEEKLRTSKLST